MKGTDMPSTPRAVWISPQAYERLHRELDTLRYLCAAEATDTDPDETPSLSNARGKYGYNRFMTCWSTPSSARTHPTTG
jgi:hypothetical protein